MRFNEATYDQAIAEAKMALNLENTTDYDGFLLLKMDECMRSFKDLATQELKTTVIPIDGGTGPLPCGFLRAMALWFSNEDGNCSLAPYVDRNIVHYCDCGPDANIGNLARSYQITGNHIQFHNPTAVDATEASLAYLGMRLDENNQPIILESHLRAGIAYLKWRFKEKMGPAEKNLGLRQVMRTEAMDSKREYMAQRRYVEGESRQRQWDEDKKSIARTFNAWVRRDNKRGMYSEP